MNDYKRTDTIAFPYGKREQEIVDWYERWRMPHDRWRQAVMETGCSGEFRPQWERAMYLYLEGDPSFLSYLLARWPGAFPMYARRRLGSFLYEPRKHNSRIKIDYVNQLQIAEFAALTALSIELRGESVSLADAQPLIETFCERTGASLSTVRAIFRKRLARIRALRAAALEKGPGYTARRYRSGRKVDS